MSRVLLVMLLFVAPASAQTLRTRWAKDVNADNAHRDYPRPQLVRKDWTNLNGHWDYAIRPKDEKKPEKFDGKILVPFPVESQLSGVGKRVGADKRLWYQRTFRAAAGKTERVLLHFGAVDWHAIVWVNGKQIGEHKGGYDPFHFDITEALKAEGEQELVVSVWDPSDKGPQPRGKQIEKPHGIWYTPVTGIWQTVWLEQIPTTYIRALKITPDVDNRKVKIEVDCSPAQDPGLLIQVSDKDFPMATPKVDASGKATATIWVPDAELWSPDNPKLYNIAVTYGDGKTSDRVKSYFAMRKIEVKKAKDGYNRIFLNNEPLFQYGPLDQGWWPDGLYTAPSDEALKYDLEVTKKLGFNMVRKHVKVEPARWYHHCDKLGLLVWQDMPSGDKYIGPNDPDSKRTAASSAIFYEEWGRIMEALHNSPCVVVWVPFNEGWGQFDTDKVLAWTKQRDPSRLVDGPSGWTDRGSGDLHDVHIYPGPGMPKTEAKRAVVLGEFGGLGLPLEGHLWQSKDNWGYRTYKTKQELNLHYRALIHQLPPLIEKGLCAAVYTQTTDVEVEVNGLLTYDRAVLKLDPERTAKLHQRLYQPPKSVERVEVVPTSERTAQEWRYTLQKEPPGWEKPEFDDAKWSKGKGGFGTAGTPGAVIGTTWQSPAIALRRTFELKDTKFHGLRLRLHHDEDAAIYVNGTLVARLAGYTTNYVELELDDEALKAFRQGVNTLAVSCRQTGGGQFIDVGFVDVIEK